MVTSLLTIYILSDVARQEYINEEEHSFTADYGSTDEFKINSVYAIDNKTLEVYFVTHPDINTVSIANYYTIRGDGYSYTATPEKVFYDATVDPYRAKLYLPESKKLVNNRDYYLTIDSRVQDYIGNFMFIVNIKFAP